jgi:Mo-co oxidoreductase dimerisation domain/Oxidoreductase molybdopterin binding domain
LIVFAQNGEAIRPEQGYPMRLFLPGWEGNISIKWLRRLEVSDKPYYTREETSKYTDLITKTGKSRIFTFTMESKSVITFPSGEMKLPGAGFYEITGLAWSGRGKIARVEVSTDDGKSWSLASLQDPVLAISQTRFRFPWIWDGGPAVIQSRATDETGYLQPTHQQLIAGGTAEVEPDRIALGACTIRHAEHCKRGKHAERGPLETGSLFYHMNAIQSRGDRQGRDRNPPRWRRPAGRQGRLCDRQESIRDQLYGVPQ